MAIIQYVPSVVLDEGVEGIIEGLSRSGLNNHENVLIDTYTAQGDMTILNSICQQVITEKYDVVVTVSTPALQAMANANRNARVMHVFGLVTDPFAAGVGLDREHPERHPAHLVGIGSFEPVAEGFRLAKRIRPDLNRVGIVFNPSEACSAACVRKAREAGAELGITIEEAPIDNSIGVLEATRALLHRDVQAFWTGGDNTLDNAFKIMKAEAARKGVPIFTSNADHVAEGAIFSYGSQYREIGRLIGDLAARALGDPASVARMPIEDVLPKRLVVNERVKDEYGAKWRAALERLRAEATE